MARPKKEINQKQFEQLCAIQCTQEEICDVLDCSEKTLIDWCKKTYKDEAGKGMSFSKVFRQKKSGGKASLRRRQWQLAENNATMAIFLGKQYLGQSDNPVSVVAEENNDGFIDALSGTASEDWSAGDV